MKQEENNSDIVEYASGVFLHLMGRIPGLGEALGGYDAYKRSAFERNVRKVTTHLQNKVADLEALFSDEWLQSDEGQQFSRKVFDSAIDMQLEDKQELFVNALINGIENRELSDLEKLKFIDILRHLSLASLMVLCNMHEMFKYQVRGPGRAVNPTEATPQVDPVRIAETLSSKYDPFLVISAIYEMESQGLFSTISEWKKQDSGSSRPGAGFSTALAYTDFTYRFVEFITDKKHNETEKDSTSDNAD